MHEETLKRILDTLKSVLGARLLSFTMYGSSHTGEFHEGYSNINTMAVVSGITVNDISAIGKELKWFFYKGNPPPLFFTQDELTSFKDVFPIEILDIIKYHTVVYGADPVKDMIVDQKHLQFQCESELKSKLIKMRQSLFTDSSNKSTVQLMTGSLSSFVAIFKGVLRLEGKDVPVQKKDVILQTAQLTGFDSSAFLKILAVREKKDKFQKEALFRTMEMYIEGIVRVINFVTRQII